MSISIEIDERIMEQANENHLLCLLEGAFDKAVQSEVSTYYPKGSILGLLPSNSDLKRARNAVLEEVHKTDFANLVPLDCDLRPYFEQKNDSHRRFLAEAVSNIDANATEIGRELLGGAKPTRILKLSAQGADSHNGSHHTLVVQTDAGPFVYKPRSVKPDASIKSLTDEIFPDMFHIPQSIDCGSFGFCEFIENANPVESNEVNDYFEALGIFCALAHFLAISDQHVENFLAQGPKLAPIDLETILGGAIRKSSLASKGSGNRFSHDMAESITSTGMLTCLSGNIYGAILAGTLHTIEPVSTHREAIEHKDQVIWGFKRGYKTCLEHKDRICQTLSSLQGTHLRVLLEGTQFYHLLLRRFFEANTWKATDSEAIEKLKRSLHLPSHARQLPEAVIASEAKSILKGDYPSFYFLPESKDLYDAQGVVVENHLASSPLALALKQLDSLDEEDMRFQCRILDEAITNMPLMAEKKPYPLQLARKPLLVETARCEAADLLALTHESIVPGVCSLGGLFATRYGQTHRSHMDCSLATGYAGVGVFAAACIASHVGNESHAEALLDICLHELDCHVGFLAERPEELAKQGFGLADGAGGIAQALQLVWRYTQDERVPSMYKTLLHSLETIDFTEAQGNNIYNGLGGLLLPLAQRVPGLPECAYVERLADVLLYRGAENEYGYRVWTESDGTCGEVGYGKGTGGIGLAFLRAWQATGCERFWNACCNAMAYEDANYHEDLGFWPLKTQTKKVCPPGICRGVSGQAIVFTQASLAGVPHAQRAAERARTCVSALPPELNDNLCCGTSAIVEGLITLGCQEEAGKLLKAQVIRKEQLGFYISENSKRKPFFNPNLFYGCLGVGYELLRYADPKTIESIFV